MAIDMKALALDGARTRISQLLSELAEIRQSFPGLDASGRAASSRVTRRRTRRRMTPAERRAVGIRMKAYWAARRAVKAKA